MRQRSRLTVVPLVCAVAALAVATGVSGASSDGLDEPSGPAPAQLDEVSVLDQSPGELIADAETLPLPIDELRPRDGAPRVFLLSSGVDAAVLPEGLRDQVTELGSVTGDPVGYGTYAASVVLQLAPGAQITSISTYPNGRFDSNWHRAILDWLHDRAEDFDVVLYAMPPSEFLDPISASMAAREWESTSDSISEWSLPGSEGPVFGLSLWDHLRNVQIRSQWGADRNAFHRFGARLSQWVHALYRVRQLREKGLSVVAPVGDLGPKPQTLLGLANFPETIAVGGFDGETASASSSAGPSMDGAVKPDLLAPTGAVGLLPESSSLARYLDAGKMLDSSLQPAWDTGEPQTSARARLDSTLAAAAVVAASVGGLAREGIRDSRKQRGALTAAAVPVDGVPVWRQGAGVLKGAPNASFAASRPLAASHGDLGRQPASGEWSATVEMLGGEAASASTSLGDFIGVGPDARNDVRSVGATDAPAVSATVGTGGVKLSLPLGHGEYRGGLYCGYTEVALPTTDGSVTPEAHIEGVPEGTEHVPTCLVQGTRLHAFGFYIHDLPAKDLTFALMPALPPGASVLDHTLHMLPVNPLDTTLFFRVTDENGDAYFPNIPPGYYRVRQFSDYGAPVRQTLTDSPSGAEVTSDSELGEPFGYQAFDALVLSAVCSDDVSGDTQACSGEFLKQRFGEENVSHEKATGGWIVSAGDTQLRVIFDFLKKMPGANVVSRYIDLLRYGDFEFTGANVAASSIQVGKLVEETEVADLWDFARDSDGTGFVATATDKALDPDGGVAVSAGIAAYPFKLTTPNYSAHLSFNFSYEMTNAAIVAAAVIGNSVSWGVVTPDGKLQVPREDGSQPLEPGNLTLWGNSSGKASFEWDFLPRGVSEGTLYLILVPTKVGAYGLNVDTTLSRASVDDVSFSLSTWTNALWPGTTFDNGVQGHSYRVNSRYSERQMSEPGCRTIDSGARKAEVCEDWQLALHSPGDDAETFDVIEPGSAETSLIGKIGARGGGLFDPRRGSRAFHHVLAFNAASVLGLELPENRFATNGEFWEQLSVPGSFLREHQGTLEFRVRDNEPGRQSTLLPHTDGPVPVAPYVPFQVKKTFLEP